MHSKAYRAPKQLYPESNAAPKDDLNLEIEVQLTIVRAVTPPPKPKKIAVEKRSYFPRLYKLANFPENRIKVVKNQFTIEIFA